MSHPSNVTTLRPLARAHSPGYPVSTVVAAAEAVRCARRAVGMSQAALARALDVDERTVRRWERGDLDVHPSVALLCPRFARALWRELAVATEERLGFQRREAA